MPAPLCHLNDIDDGGCKGFIVDNASLFLVRQGSAIYAYLNRCPHLGLPLEWQANQFLSDDHSLIQCATHGALFEITSGHCVYGPCEGQRLAPISVSIDNNLVYLDMDKNDQTIG